MKIILDASMALSWLFEREKPEEQACSIQVLSSAEHNELWVPVLWHTEVANALLVGERRRILTEAQSMDYCQRLSHLPIHTDGAPVSQPMQATLALAREHQLTAYDATYLELALRLKASLASFDQKLLVAARRAGCVVHCGFTKSL